MDEGKNSSEIDLSLTQTGITIQRIGISLYSVVDVDVKRINFNLQLNRMEWNDCTNFSHSHSELKKCVC